MKTKNLGVSKACPYEDCRKTLLRDYNSLTKEELSLWKSKCPHCHKKVKMELVKKVVIKASKILILFVILWGAFYFMNESRVEYADYIE